MHPQASEDVEFTLNAFEILDMVLMSLATGFIFMDAFKSTNEDPVAAWTQQSSWWNRFWYSVALVAPAIILHELGHKIVALVNGLAATFHAAYGWLGIGIVLKLVKFPFLIMVPAYVSIVGQATPLQHAAIAFAGPAINGILFLIALFVIKTQKLSAGRYRFWQYVKFVNGFLCVFNMLPIPGFDGLKVYEGLWAQFIA